MFFTGDYAPNGRKVRIPAMMRAGTLLANLESPLIDKVPIPPAEFKSGPSLYSTSLGLQEIGNATMAFSIANNHIMDYGIAGLTSTMQQLDELGIKYVGAGLSISAARQPIIITADGFRIGIIGCREAQFGSKNCADIGWWVFDVIHDLKTKVDKIVVSVHAAAEDSPFPSPLICHLYRHFIEAGADVVHGHHSHVPQGWEYYQNGVIFYGLGNFVVDPAVWPAFANRWSIVANVDFSYTRPKASIYYCECVDDGEKGISIHKHDILENDSANKYLEICKHALSCNKLTEGYWQDSACRLYERTYGSPLCHPSFTANRLEKYGRIHFVAEGVRKIAEGLLGRRLPSQRSISAAANTYNCTQCLSHSEMIKTAMGIMLGNIDDLRNSEIAADCDFVFHFLAE